MTGELSALLNTMLWGKRYISVKDARSKGHMLIAKELELQDKIWIDFIYKQALANGKEEGLMPSSELAIFLEDCGIWTKKDNKEIQKLKISLAKIEETLNEEEITKRERKFSLKLKRTLRAELNKKENLKSNHFVNSLETHASTERVNASVFCSLYKDPDNKYWASWEDFLEETDGIFIKNATIQIFDKTPATVKQIREIARSATWRFKWNAYKTSGDLFGKPLMNLTNDQDSLLYWSQVYDAAYDSMDRPAEEIINDDDALDGWFEEQAKKRKTKQAESGKGGVGRKGTSKIWRHSEVGIVVNPGAQADLNRSAKLGIAKDTYVPTAKEVNDMNGPLQKKFLEHQRNKIKKHGVIEERDLRSDGNSRRAIGSKDVIFKKARRKDGFTGKQVVEKMPGGTLKGRKE